MQACTEEVGLCCQQHLPAGSSDCENDDGRYSSWRAVCMAVHRTLLLSPVLGLGCRLGRHCVPMLEIPHHMRLNASSLLVQGGEEEAEPLPAGSHGLYTWKGLNSVFVTLLKHTPDSTAIYVHPSDMHYHAAPLGSLGPGCPVGTTLLAQVVLDCRRSSEEQSWQVSVLVFDAMQIGLEDFVQMQMPPEERYARLRALCTTSLDPATGRSNVLTSPAMKLQWAGDYGALRSFCSGPGSHANIDHIPDCYFQYTRKHPCKILVTD